MHVIYHAPGERQTETANTGTVDIYQLATTAAAAVDDAVAMPCATGRATCTSSGLQRAKPSLFSPSLSFSPFQALSCTT